MPGQFFSPEGDLEDYFVTEYWLIDQYIGDELWTWGYNSNGQLGNAVLTSVSTPSTTFSGQTNWKEISCGYFHTAAIKTDGTLWVWGQGTYGKLGNAVIAGNISTPMTTFTGGTNWQQISCSYRHTAAIKTDGTLWVWGSTSSGRLGNGITAAGNVSTPITTFTGGTNWKSVSAGQSNTVAIKTDGTLWTWGAPGAGALGNAVVGGFFGSTPSTTFAGGNNWKQVSCGASRVAAIKTDGTLWTWGSGSQGQLGSANLSNRSTPSTTFAGGSNWKSVFVGSGSMAAIKTDGTLWTWGSGSTGQLGNAQITDKSTPVTTFAGGANWKQVSNAGFHMAAIKTDGTLWTWGYGTYGRLGNAVITGNISTPITTFAGGSNWKQSSCAPSNTAVVQAGINPQYPLS
jgi:alpha-tubulin suppressor-like RCC1 family protein